RYSQVTSNLMSYYGMCGLAKECLHQCQNSRTIGCTRFSRRNFGPRLLAYTRAVMNRFEESMKYATAYKILKDTDGCDKDWI
ncbi:hypothetical protein ACJX0J_021806, partial [Zea mays]